MIFRRFEDVCCWFLHWISWMSAIFLLPFYLTYWPRKCFTCCVPCEDFHRVWSWYNHPLPSYSVLAVFSNHNFLLMASNFGNLTALRVIFSHMFTAHSPKKLFTNFRWKFWHHHLISWPRFPYRARYFDDLRAFSVFYGRPM